MKTNTRIKITKTIFREALLDILKEKPVHFVTVTELCRKAELNRGTFYAYYNIPDDVLKEIEDTFVGDCLEILSEKPDKGIYGCLPAVYTYMKENLDTMKILLGANGSVRFSERIRDTAYQYIVKQWSVRYPYVEEKDFEFIFDTVYYGGGKNIIKWMEGEYDISMKELVRRSNMIISYCLDALERFNGKNKPE